jgi:hypothetical protein
VWFSWIGSLLENNQSVIVIRLIAVIIAVAEVALLFGDYYPELAGKE